MSVTLIYNLLQNKIKTLKEYIDKNHTNFFIYHSKFLARAPILFVKKKDGVLYVCVDY